MIIGASLRCQEVIIPSIHDITPQRAVSGIMKTPGVQIGREAKRPVGVLRAEKNADVAEVAVDPPGPSWPTRFIPQRPGRKIPIVIVEVHQGRHDDLPLLTEATRARRDRLGPRERG